jgi:hypothetical protein
MINYTIVVAQNNQVNNAAPKIIKTIPAFGDKRVDPSITEIILEFDQDMLDGYSLIDYPNMPELQGECKWLTKRRCSISVRLYSNRQYKIGFNNEKYFNFQNQSGIPLKQSILEFHTKKVPHDNKEISPAPKIVKTIPAFGDKQVDPNTTEIILEFDQDMAGGCSIIKCSNMPVIKGDPKWITKRKLSIQIELNSNRKFQLIFNNEHFCNFKNEARIPMKQSILKFHTKK